MKTMILPIFFEDVDIMFTLSTIQKLFTISIITQDNIFHKTQVI